MVILSEILVIFLLVYGLATQVLIPVFLNQKTFPVFRKEEPTKSPLDIHSEIENAMLEQEKLAATKRELKSKTQAARTEAAELDQAVNQIGKNI